MKNILVVGGAGYIGSHMVKMLAMNNFHPIILDDLSTGFSCAVKYGEFHEGSTEYRSTLETVLSHYDIEAVMHFASFSQVGESVKQPHKYYQNNVSNTLTLLDAMSEHGVNQFIFSSTAAIFGNPVEPRIDESHPMNPINPYGRSKLMVEQTLEDYERAFGIRSIALRYFNAAGADSEGELGERHDPETHLIPLALQAAMGLRQEITIFGDDYPTDDGTCVRDYIHIEDLCSAHLLALNALIDGASSNVYNLGNGNGFSVREVINTVEQVTGWKVPVEMGTRREGDPAVLVADATKAQRELGWHPKYTELSEIIRHAANWEMIKHSERGVVSGSNRGSNQTFAAISEQPLA